MSLAARYGPLRSIQTKALWRELPSATTHFGFWINPSLLCPSWPYVSWNRHWNGAPFGFQCCFLVNQCRILSQINRSISKTQIHICHLHRTLQTCVIWIALSGLNLKPLIHIFVFIPAHIQAWAFWLQEQRNRNTGKQEHLKTGTEQQVHCKWEKWNSRNNGKQEHLETETMENRNTGKQEHWKTNTGKQEHWK